MYGTKGKVVYLHFDELAFYIVDIDLGMMTHIKSLLCRTQSISLFLSTS